MIIGMIAIFAGFSAAALAAWGDSRFLMAAPVSTLIGMALTGQFIVKGRYGLAGRGKWLVGVGALIPLAYWLFSQGQ